MELAEADPVTFQRITEQCGAVEARFGIEQQRVAVRIAGVPVHEGMPRRMHDNAQAVTALLRVEPGAADAGRQGLGRAGGRRQQEAQQTAEEAVQGGSHTMPLRQKRVLRVGLSGPLCGLGELRE